MAIIDSIRPLLPFPPNLGNSESFRFRPGLITQLDVDDVSGASGDISTGIDTPGPLFDFNPGSQWLSMGRFTTPNQTLYGFRTQRAGRGLLIGYKGPTQNQSSIPPLVQQLSNGLETNLYLLEI